MVTHEKLQFYQHRYGLVFITGLLGCKWHRYKQSTRDSRKRDLLMFAVVLLTFLFITFFLYFALIAKNDSSDLNIFMYNVFGTWVASYTIALVVICVLYAYFLLLMVLSFCHIIHGHQLYIHPCHVLSAFVVLGMCITCMVFIDKYWHSEWHVMYLSLLVFWPFLQIALVVLMTAVSWMIVSQWFSLSSCGCKLLWLCVYMCVMLFLYFSPLLIQSPCVIQDAELPPKPLIIGHKGAPYNAPENTMISFEYAANFGVYGFETDVTITRDGEPVLFPDSTLTRTTNIRAVYPDRVHEPVSSFNYSELMALEAGSWFLENNPNSDGTQSLSEETKAQFREQKIPTLLELLHLAKRTDKFVMLHISNSSMSHFANTSADIVIATINKSNINSQKIFWIQQDRDVSSQNYTMVSREILPVDELQHNNVSMLHVEQNEISLNNINRYWQHNISTNVYMVNTRWLFSVFWCGTNNVSVATERCSDLNKMQQPVWHLDPRSYLMIWISVDVISAVFIIVFFTVQRIHNVGNRYVPETEEFGINHQRNESYRRNRKAMKEKLLMKDVNSDFFDTETDGEDKYGIEANYTVASMDGRVLAQKFHQTRINTKYRSNDSSDPLQDL